MCETGTGQQVAQLLDNYMMMMMMMNLCAKNAKHVCRGGAYVRILNLCAMLALEVDSRPGQFILE
jgi:hypothetical protein